jgi:hypothetical protein
LDFGAVLLAFVLSCGGLRTQRSHLLNIPLRAMLAPEVERQQQLEA